MQKQALSRSGFTLFEMSIVLLILSILAGSILTIVTQQVRSRTIGEMNMRFDAIEKALKEFRQATNRLPCPASLTITPTTQTFGFEAENEGSCTGGAIEADFTSGDMAGGMIPVRTLNLPDEYAFDPWGGRIVYAVDVNATGILGGTITDGQPDGVLNNRLPVGATGTVYPITPVLGSATLGNMTVEDGQGNDKVTNAMVVVLSHGMNGHGAYQLRGARKFIGSENTEEQENCDCNETAATAIDTVFVDQVYTAASELTFDRYDDMLRYYIRQDFPSDNDALTETYY